jgi:hypothetical protein
MTTPRRQLLMLGLGGGLMAMLRNAAAQPATDCMPARPLRFQLDSSWQPDLSADAASAMVRALLAFLHDSHPPGMTLSMWTQNPRQMPFLPAHLERVVEGVFAGVRSNLGTWPVDPLLVLSLVYNESRFNPVAVSPAGAAGMGQFMPDTALEYGLSPVAGQAGWERLRAQRQVDRQRRNAEVARFRERWGVAAFTAEAALARALELRDWELLADYRRVAALRGEADALRQDYVRTLREAFAAADFFNGGAAQLAALDARTGYQALAAAVTYIARQLRQNSGMATSAVAAYNAGPARVRVSSPESILYPVGDIPPLPETVRYVQRILAVYSAVAARL